MLADALAVAHGAVFFGLLFAAAFLDLRKKIIPNALVGAGLLLGFWLAYVRGELGSVWDGNPVGLVSALAGAVFLFVIFYFFYRLGGMGGGDVKLMAAVGALTGLRFGAWVLFNTSVVGMALAIGTLLWHGRLREGLRSSMRFFSKKNRQEDAADKKQLTIPYGVAVLLGALWTVWMYMGRGMPLPFL